MGNAGAKLKEGFETVGKRIGEGFQTVGKKLNEGWEGAKNLGKQAWDATIGKVPVLRDIVSGVIEASPIGMATRALDATVGVGSKVALDTGLGRASDWVNQKNSLVEAAKGVPIIGDAVSEFDNSINNRPIFAGMSANDLKGIANAGINAAQVASETGDLKTAGLIGGMGLAEAAMNHF